MTETPTDPNREDYFCSDLSRQSGEGLFGTAPRTDVFFLLEYAGPWGAKALNESDLSPEVKEWLASLLTSVPRSNLLLIKQEMPEPHAQLAFYAALARESNPVLFRYELGRYEELLDLDVPVSAEADAPVSSEPLFLICTNGRRDRCCARYGIGVYKALVSEVGRAAWQSTHIGGHRFAGNFYCFPHGILYGRVEGHDVARLVADYRGGQVTLDRLRGRSCYEPAAQAAEYFLRKQTGVRDLDSYQLTEHEPTGEKTWVVRFRSNRDGSLHHLELVEEATGVELFQSCGSDKLSPATTHRLLEHAVLK